MAKRALTATVASTSTAVTAPTDKDWLKARNLDTSYGIWVSISGTATSASVGGDECEYIGPGESTLLPYLATYYMISTAGSPQVNLVTAAGRI